MKYKTYIWIGSIIAVAILIAWFYLRSNPYNAASIGEIPLPRNYVRVEVSEGSFAAWLRNVPLKRRGSKVHLFYGNYANFQWLSAGVIDMPLLSNDEQCADVCMRLRAEDLFESGEYDKIHFTALDGKELIYTGGNDRKAFENYLRQVFSRCNTSSLYVSLPSRDIKDIQIGDVFIYPHRRSGGKSHYGHAVMVADMAVNPRSGKKIFLLVEGNTPARDVHILRNFNPIDNPWFYLDEDAETMRFNVFRFTNKDLRYFD